MTQVLEKELIGSTPVRNFDLSFKAPCPFVNLVTEEEEPKVYQAKNPRHTQKELVRYQLATRRAMEAAPSLAFCRSAICTFLFP